MIQIVAILWIATTQGMTVGPHLTQFDMQGAT